MTSLLAVFTFCAVSASFQVAVGADESARKRWEFTVVAGSVNEHPCTWMLDTGADFTAMDTMKLNAMHVQPVNVNEATLPSGVHRVTRYEQVRIQLKNHQSVELGPVGLDLQLISGKAQVPFEGIAGLDAISQHTVVITTGTVSLHESLPKNFEILEVCLPAGRQIADQASIGVEFPGIGIREFRIDTGMTGCGCVDSELTAMLADAEQSVPGMSALGITMQGEYTLKSNIVRELTFAGTTFRNVPMTVGRYNAVGLELLQHVNLALDFPRRQIVIGKPPKNIVERFAMNASGMALRFDSAETLQVLAIRPDSPAETAGVKVNDVIVQLDGRNPVELSIYDIHEILARNGKTISVMFRRGKDEQHIKLALRLPFEYPPNWAELDARQEDFEKFLEKLEGDPTPAPEP